MENAEELKKPAEGNQPATVNQQDGNGENGSGAQNQNQNSVSQNGKEGAWLSQLPGWMRKSFDPHEIPNQRVLAEKYLELREKLENTDGTQSQPHDTRTYSEEDYRKIEDLFSDQGDRKLLGFLKENNVDPEKIRKFVDGLKPSEEDRKIMLEVQRQTVQGELSRRWGDNLEANNNYYRRALSAYSKEEQDRIASKGLNFDADFIDLLSKYGRAMSEGTPADSSFGSQKKSKEATFKAWGFI